MIGQLSRAANVGLAGLLADDLTGRRHYRQRVVPGPIGTQRAIEEPETAHDLTDRTTTRTRGMPADVAAVRFPCNPAARTITAQAIHARRAPNCGS